MQTDELKRLIEAGLPDSQVEVYSEDCVHFQARVVSAAFAGQSTVQQHRMVYACLGQRMGNEVHALSLRTAVPDAG